MGETVEPDIDDSNRQLDAVTMSKNLAEDLDEDVLESLGSECKDGYEADLNSRSHWEEQIDDWLELAMQIPEEKSFPWAGAASVKYPLISTATMQFNARAYPSLVPSNGQVVKASVIGKDRTGEKGLKAERVSTYMSYQLMKQLPYWEEEMDRMLIMLPVIGCMFKKTYYCKAEDRIESKLILPTNLVVNYWTKTLEESERISEREYVSKRLLKERQLMGLYREVELGDPTMPTEAEPGADQETAPYEIIEQHMYHDLDDDGYMEPLIVTFERNSGKVLRVAMRYSLEDVQRDDSDNIVKIRPMHFFTKFGMVPSPDGSFYDIGFGTLLGPLNDSVNTLINQLLDAGTLHNLNAGFMGKALRIRAGDTSFTPGEWKTVNATGDDLRKQIVPLPSREPSGVLLELLKFLIQAGKELASVAEIFTGKMPGQNTPATTTMATVEQGMKVFTAVYKRIFRSLSSEFYKVFVLNSKYLDPNKYVAVLDDTIGPDDFNLELIDICPAADPTATSQNEKVQKVQALMGIMQSMPGILDPIEVVRRFLEATEQPSPEKLFSQQVQQSGQLPPPPPDPKMMALQAKAQADQQASQIRMQEVQQKMELASRDKSLQMQMAQEQHAQQMQMERERRQQEAAAELATTQVKIAAQQMQHVQKVNQAKELQSSKQSSNQNGKSGSNTR